MRLPSGAEREGTVFYRGVDADYATQRDVSRTKRDIKTFEIRLRCDNADRSLAVGMTAYVDCCRWPNAAERIVCCDVEVDNLTKRFGDFCAVDALSFTVEHGEVFGLLGPERRGQVHAHPHADDAGAADLRHGARQRLRHRPRTPTTCASPSASFRRR